MPLRPAHRSARLFPAPLWLLFGLIGWWAVPGSARAQVQVQDIAVESRFQGDFGGHFARGRALVAADFDLDGRIDFFIGNPGDESYVLRNVQRAGRTQFLVTQILLKDALAWGASTADYDNDGDYDLFITTGANEGIGLDYLFKNMFVEEGRLRFEDVSAEAGVQGPLDLNGDPIETAGANADWCDVDHDGDVDLFVSVNIWNGTGMDGPEILQTPGDAAPVPENLLGSYSTGQNLLYRNNGDGTFTYIAPLVGLTKAKSTRHSTFVDIDNDGDCDLFENNYNTSNFLWRNLLVETGTLQFEDVTAEFSPEGEDLSYPKLSFVSCAADFNNDGWEDLILFMRNAGPEPGSPYPEGHALFLNDAGTGFRNVAQDAGINVNYVSAKNQGVMGSQIGDVNADGVPDIYIGNGGPSLGMNDQFFLSTSAVGANPVYEDWTANIDFAAPVNARTTANYPDYPYRTHGTAFVDVDGDGLLEVAVINGGPAFDPDDNEMQQPNRLFKFEGWDPMPNFFKVRPVGDGVHVSKDAIGARVSLQVGFGTDQSWNLYRTQRGSSCFSAQNGFELFFGLGNADLIKEVQVNWPDGTSTVISDGLTVNSAVVVHYAGTVEQAAPRRREAAAPEPARLAAAPGSETPLAFSLSEAYPNPFNPSTRITYALPEATHVRLKVYDPLGREVATLVDGLTEAGRHSAVWRAGAAPSGLYLYRLEAGSFSRTRTMLLIK
jgi:hypothetical protein